MANIKISRTLKLQSPYMQGNDVKHLQRYLNALGYAPVLKEDGIFGQKTADAVLNFQLSYGEKFNKDGIVTPNLFNFIAKVVEMQAPQALIQQDNISKPFSFQVKPQDVSLQTDYYNQSKGLSGFGWLLILLASIGFIYFKKKEPVGV